MGTPARARVCTQVSEPLRPVCHFPAWLRTPVAPALLTGVVLGPHPLGLGPVTGLRTPSPPHAPSPHPPPCFQLLCGSPGSSGQRPRPTHPALISQAMPVPATSSPEDCVHPSPLSATGRTVLSLECPLLPSFFKSSPPPPPGLSIPSGHANILQELGALLAFCFFFPGETRTCTWLMLCAQSLFPMWPSTSTAGSLGLGARGGALGMQALPPLKDPRAGRQPLGAPPSLPGQLRTRWRK